MKKNLFSLIIWGTFVSTGSAAGVTESALTLLEPSSARIAALGESCTALRNDINAIPCNPASLDTLRSSQVSFLFQRGLSNDNFGRVGLGIPADKHAFGLDVRTYNSGSLDLYDGVASRHVTGQKDLSLALSHASSFWRRYSYGSSLKVLQSEIAEQSKATAYAVDLGMAYVLNRKSSIALSFLNLGTRLQYQSEEHRLPAAGRLGFIRYFSLKSVPALLSFDVPYFFVTQKITPAVGLEFNPGILSVRAGYKTGSDLAQFSFGTGVHYRQVAVDYAFGLVDKFESQHRISVTFSFGRFIGIPKRLYDEEIFMKEELIAPTPPLTEETKVVPPAHEPVIYEMQPAAGTNPGRQVYIVKEGDTMQSIAKLYLGRAALWTYIYQANIHLGLNPEHLAAGQKILIPDAPGIAP